MPVPVFTAGEVLTAANMNQIGLFRINTCTATSSGGTSATASDGIISIGSGNTSVSINNAFSTNYNAYKVIITGFTSSAAQTIYLKFNNSAGATYSSVLTYFGYTTATAVNENLNASSNGIAVFFGSTTYATSEIEIFSPFVSSRTTARSSGVNTANPQDSRGIDTNSASHTGFSLSVTTGSMTTGTIRVYGYRN